MSTSNSLMPPASRGTDLLDVFPRRRIHIYFGGTVDNTLTMFAMALVFGVLVLLSMGLSLPDIARDAAMKREGKSVVEENAEIDGACRRMKFIFVDCEAKITYRPDPAVDQLATVEQSYLFLGTSYETTVDVLRSTVRPERVTTTLGTAHIGNRIFTLLVLCAVLGALSCLCARMGWRSKQRVRLEGKKMELRPLIVTVRDIDRHNNVRFESTVDGVQVKSSNRLRVGDQPLYLPGTPGLALAVAVPDSPLLILIDHDLTVLAFTEQERAQIRAALA
ncbi:hypothetical protein [Massilia sp. CF038]|uniref:hypothetical protein n=1 Tax=Massilia sp. CF038 TaxID=1881045 RepID=UPI000915536E|nr:hypothetical protein [Massilia sp. CF038]SHH66966.1 hypothetical protein SAMN05428948_4857 [Massilia sp. CF038]